MNLFDQMPIEEQRRYLLDELAETYRAIHERQRELCDWQMAYGRTVLALLKVGVTEVEIAVMLDAEDSKFARKDTG